MTAPNFSGTDGPDLPELHDAVIIAAFEGWNDAADAASDALDHLDAIWSARPIIEIDDESYYDYQVNRPVIRQVDGVTRELVWPSMQISHCRPPGSDRDIVLMHGVEPNMRWRSFCAELLTIADKLNVDTVVILGALLADTPHTRPVPVVRHHVDAGLETSPGQDQHLEVPAGVGDSPQYRSRQEYDEACSGRGPCKPRRDRRSFVPRAPVAAEKQREQHSQHA